MASSFRLRRHDNSGQRDISLHPGCGVGAAFGAVECSWLPRDWADRIPSGLPLCPQPSGQGLFPASSHSGGRQRIERSAESLLACNAGGGAAVAGGGRSIGKWRHRCRNSGGGVVRVGRNRATGVAGGARPRSAATYEYHHPGDARNLVGQFRGRCNQSYAARPRSMTVWRRVAWVVLLLVTVVSLAANWLAPAGYAKQYREAVNAPPSREHLLGTDDIGRDRFARVLYGTRISLLLAPAAALLSTLMAAFVGGVAGYPGGNRGRGGMAGAGSFPSLPRVWLLMPGRGLM